MNLEAIEQKCVAYLKQVSKPLVPVENLMRHLREDEDCAGFTERELIEFLRVHELFKVIEPPRGQEDPEVIQALAEFGIPVGPRVILSTRVPTKSEIAAMIQQELGDMTDALTGAMAEAREMGDTEAEDQVLDALARTEKLKRMARDILGEGAGD